MSLCLTDEEVIALTGKRRHDAQVRELRTMGIEHRIRGDGSPMVLRVHLEGESSGARVKEYAFGTIKRATTTQP